jgi:hypothetical protein
LKPDITYVVSGFVVFPGRGQFRSQFAPRCDWSASTMIWRVAESRRSRKVSAWVMLDCLGCPAVVARATGAACRATMRAHFVVA